MSDSPLKIVHLVSGAGGMYCGSCMHAGTLAAALVRAGHDVTLLPLYTPLRTDEEDLSEHRLSYGGLNVYLQQRFALFRASPRLLDWLLDRPGLVRWLSRWAGRTDARRLGELTVSMLRGQSGRQAKELAKLLDRLSGEFQPDIVHLSNLLLAGLAGPIRRRLGVPVVVSLTGEDVFLEKLPEPHCSEARRQLRLCAEQVDTIVALNEYFANRMAEYLAADRARIEVIPAGLKLAGHAAELGPGPPLPPQAGRSDFRIGYFSRVCPEKGLHLLADAFEQVVRRRPDCRLRLDAAGYLAAEDRPYLKQIERRLSAPELAGRFRYLGSPDRKEKIAFLQSVDAVSLPAVFPESKGLACLEAWANARPVVAPSHGVFPELVEDTGGGILYDPGDPTALAEAITGLAADRDRAAAIGRRGLEAVRNRYHDGLMAERMARLYRRTVDRATGPPG